MSNPIQTGDGAGMAVEGIKSIVGMFKGDKKNKRKDSFSEGVFHDKILKTARDMAKDKYKYKLAKLDKVTAAIKPGTKGEVVTGKSRITGTFAGPKPDKPEVKRTTTVTAAATPRTKTDTKKSMTTKQAAVSAPTPKKAAAKPKPKAATAKTPPPTAARARKVK
jgi:hypothetical protein